MACDTFSEDRIMKTLTVFAAAAILAGSSFAQDQGNLSAPTVQRRALPPENPAHTEGGLQRGVRLGNVAQMFNPFASQRYGDGREFVTDRPEGVDPQPRERVRKEQPVGLRLFSVAF